ncbi:hypothetical protein BDZ97DRAFT_1150283 [Flammula alnicola]|nr:hypothetical protein BDZ97DRAFT_1150283 [Flammula alnicola]
MLARDRVLTSRCETQTIECDMKWLCSSSSRSNAVPHHLPCNCWVLGRVFAHAGCHLWLLGAGVCTRTCWALDESLWVLGAGVQCTRTSLLDTGCLSWLALCWMLDTFHGVCMLDDGGLSWLAYAGLHVHVNKPLLNAGCWMLFVIPPCSFH